MVWQSPEKPAEITEKRLIEAILDGHFPINSTLPGERSLAEQLGVTRPTLREAMQRLARDGWLEINQGKPTRVRNYWQEGSLAVLASVARHHRHLPDDFICNLLIVRQLLAPTYASLAVKNSPGELVSLLDRILMIPGDAPSYAAADWELHYKMTVSSGNPLFTLILNGFKDLYPEIGEVYFRSSEARERSMGFYKELRTCAQAGDSVAAKQVTESVMKDSIEIWNRISEG